MQREGRGMWPCSDGTGSLRLDALLCPPPIPLSRPAVPDVHWHGEELPRYVLCGRQPCAAPAAGGAQRGPAAQHGERLPAAVSQLQASAGAGAPPTSQVTYMSPERIEGKPYSFPADIW